MSIVFKILHIPTGECITAHKNTTERGLPVSFYDIASAMNFLDSIIYKTLPYIYGGPSTDYYLGSIPIPKYVPFPLLSEFELLPINTETLSFAERQKIIQIADQPLVNFGYHYV